MPTFHDTSCTGGPVLVPGAARGLRACRLGRDGLLRGVTYPQPWRPGVNVSRCLVTARTDEPVARWTSGELQDRWYWVQAGVGFPHDPDAPLETLPGWEFEPCTGLEAKCACGFYAYHDGGMHLYLVNPDYMCVMVEGFGKVILGPWGFRASKARMLAGVTPKGWAQHQLETVEAMVRRGQEALVALDPRPENAWVKRHLESILARSTFMVQQLRRVAPATLSRQTHAMRRQYPDLPLYDDMASLLRDYPLEDLTPLLDAR